jgi:hypothetical protein
MSLVTTVGVCTLTESMGPTIAFTGGVVVGADANCSPRSPNTARTCQLKSAWSTQRRWWCLRRQLRRRDGTGEDTGMGGPVCVVVADDDVLLREGQPCWKAPDSTSSGGSATGAAARTDQRQDGAGRDGVCAGGERGLNRALSARRLHRGCVGGPAVVCRATDTTGCGHAGALRLFAATSRGPRTFVPRWKASAPRALRTGLGRVPAQPGGAGTRGTLVLTDIRCAPRRPAVVAVGETRQPDRRPHHRRGPDQPPRNCAAT